MGTYREKGAADTDEEKKRTYIAIDLKSFYASVECRERGLNPLTTNLVVADRSRTEKTICLAVTPALKAYGIPGRARLFEVVEKVKEINARRLQNAPGHKFTGSSCDAAELAADPSLELDYIAAPPRMRHYMRFSGGIFHIYLNYVAPEDIHVYSVDEVFMDVTDYLKTYALTARELAVRIIREVLHATGITATAGIGTNLYLAKIAMDIEAKRSPADADGVRIAELDELSYRQKLWAHRPLTDFWRVGRGYARKLEANGLYTMGDIARCSLGGENDYYNEALLYRLFGVNAELLIDHAWGWEPCTIADIKRYVPESNSLSSGQVLHMPYDFDKAKLVVREMTDQLVLDLVSKKLVTDQMVLTVGYDIENLLDPERMAKYTGEVTTDGYGRKIPKHAHGSVNLGGHTSSTRRITEAVMELFDRVVDPALTVRRMYVVANNILPEAEAALSGGGEQMDLFSDFPDAAPGKKKEPDEREKRRQQAILDIQKRYGKNAILKGMNLEEGATARSRNGQVGGHRA